MADIKYYDVILKPVITERVWPVWAKRNILSWFIRMQTRHRLKKLWKNVRWR